MRRVFITVLAGLVVVSLAGCGKPSESGQPDSKGSGLSGTVKVDGSSTVFLISEAVAEEFQKTEPGVQVTVARTGTGGGFKRFCAGETDVQDASRPITPGEVDLCAMNQIEYIELPVAYDGLTIVVNPKNDWAKHITTAELKKMWEPAAQAKITKWNQVRPGWPDKEIHLFGAGVDSGTYEYFTDAINNKAKSSRGDYTSSEDDNVLVQGVSKDELALGYFGLAYYEASKDKLAMVPVDDGKAENGAGPIPASAETVKDGTYQPLSRPLFIYVSKKALDRPEVAAFTKYYLAEGAKLSEEVKYIPLPAKAYELAQKRVDARKTGSLFLGKGSQVGVRIEQLLESELADDGK
jgi:phosphate transport system substrate-binding protein